jgi:hypothetical protein
MSSLYRFNRIGTVLSVALFLFAAVAAQEKSKDPPPTGKAVIWKSVDVAQQDLFQGPGGRDLAPDVSTITFIREEKGGYNKKYRIKDASGRTWVAKIGREAQPETAAVRILAALGYQTEINYLVPKLTIPGQGSFENVRLEARPENIKRLGRWEWDKTPFTGTNELQGLKIMMALFNNWDMKPGNNIILQNGGEHYYAISDLGATFGKFGSNNLPIFWRLGRSINKPESYSESDFIKEIEGGQIEFSLKGRGKGNSVFDDVTVANGRWLADLLTQLSDSQLQDAFRAANYSPEDIKTLSFAVKSRITALDSATKRSAAGGF